MDGVRSIGDVFPPVVNATLFIKNTGEVTASSAGRMSKTKAREILDLIPDIKNGTVRAYITWLGQWSSDIFEVKPEDADRYEARIREYI